MAQSAIIPIGSAAEAAQALSASFAGYDIIKDPKSIQSALESQLGSDLTGNNIVSYGNVTGQMSATSAPDNLLLQSPMIFRYVILAVDAITRPLFALFSFNTIAANQRQLISQEVVYHADTWDRGVEYNPGTTQTQTSQKIQSYTQQFVKGISMDLNLFLTPQGYAEYMRQAYQFAVAYALTFVMLIVDALNKVPAIKEQNPTPYEAGQSYVEFIKEKRDVFAAPIKGENGLTRVVNILSRYSSANPSGRISALLGPEDLQQRLDQAGNSTLVLNSSQITIDKPPVLKGLEVVAVKPVYRPGSALHYEDLCTSATGFVTYSMCQAPIDAEEKTSKFYMYDLAMDQLLSVSLEQLEAAAADFDGVAAGDAKDHDYLIGRVYTFRGKTVYGIAPGSISLYSSVPTVLTSVSVMRMDVNTQGRFYGGDLITNPGGVVPLNNFFITDVTSVSGTGFLTAKNISDHKGDLFAAAQATNKYTFVVRMDKKAGGRGLPAFLPVTLGDYKVMNQIVDSASLTELNQKYVLAGENLKGTATDLLNAIVGYEAKASALVHFDKDRNMFKRPVLMYRDYCGYVFRGAGNALLDAGEVQSEAPFGRVVQGLGKILTGAAQGDSRVTSLMPSPMQPILTMLR